MNAQLDIDDRYSAIGLITMVAVSLRTNSLWSGWEIMVTREYWIELFVVMEELK